MLYVLLHATVRRTFIGATIRGWLVNLPLLVALFLVLLGQPIAWSIAIVVVALILRLLYWRADRNGYVRFEVEQVQQPGGSATDIVDNQKVVTRATGKFSVKDWQEYVLAQPAEYWRVPMGDHAIMVRNGSGRFLYQFIRRGAIEAIEAGLLYHGRRPHEALAITYLTSWGPESEDPNFMFYAPSDEGDPARKQLKLYLAFEDKGTRDSVWHSLLGDGQQL
jgi:hypothetical protein